MREQNATCYPAPSLLESNFSAVGRAGVGGAPPAGTDVF
jgi:hypothetical protein